VTGKGVGDLDEGSTGDTTEGTTDGPEPTGTDTGVPAICPDVETECTTFDLCGSDGCGGPLSQWDEDGCPRPSCGADGSCPDGRVCLRLGDWGQCGASSWGCELFEGECLCGGTADCSEGAAHCIPEEIAPPAVERCIPPNPGNAFSIEPALGETTGTAACTVLATAPLQLDCTGDFVGVHTVTINSALPPAFTVGENVTLEHTARAEVEWLDAWLRILDDEGLFRVVAVQATDILPPDVTPADFWTSPLYEVTTVDIGCLEARCGEEPGAATGKAIRVDIGGGALDYAGGESGGLPGKFGGEMGHVTVHEAREGACGATLGDQPGWVSFSVVDILG
jgi:hypothetical protein